MEDPRQLWGQRIRLARHTVGMTQKQLAAAMSVDQQLVSQWETGGCAPRDDKRATLARILGVNAEALFAYPDPDDTNGDEKAA